MEVYKLHELYVMVVCTLSGVFTGAFFDFLRASKKHLPQKFHPVGDLLFWIGATIIFYLSIHFSNNAKIRWYEFLGLSLGFYLYFLLFGKYVFSFFSVVTGVFFTVLKKLKRMYVKFFSRVKKAFAPAKNFFYEKKSRLFFSVHKKTFKFFNKFKKHGKNNSEKN